MCALSRLAGLDLDVLRRALGDSAASSALIRRDLDALLDGEYLASFELDRCCEELAGVTGLAREYQVPHELSAVAERIYHHALSRYGPVGGELLAVALLEEEYAEYDQLTPPQKQDEKHDDYDDNNCPQSDEHRFPLSDGRPHL
jgi:NADP-dependent 3-hydroxyisobutyrate dehydrogenase-like protein